MVCCCKAIIVCLYKAISVGEGHFCWPWTRTKAGWSQKISSNWDDQDGTSYKADHQLYQQLSFGRPKLYKVFVYWFVATPITAMMACQYPAWTYFLWLQNAHGQVVSLYIAFLCGSLQPIFNIVYIIIHYNQETLSVRLQHISKLTDNWVSGCYVDISIKK